MSKVYVKLQYQIQYNGTFEKAQDFFGKLPAKLFNKKQDALDALYNTPSRYEWLSVSSDEFTVREVIATYAKDSGFFSRFGASLKDAFKTNDAAKGIFGLGVIILVVGVVIGTVGGVFFGEGISWEYAWVLVPFFGFALYGWFGGALIEMNRKKEDRLLKVENTEWVVEPEYYF